MVGREIHLEIDNSTLPCGLIYIYIPAGGLRGHSFHHRIVRDAPLDHRCSRASSATAVAAVEFHAPRCGMGKRKGKRRRGKTNYTVTNQRGQPVEESKAVALKKYTPSPKNTYRSGRRIQGKLHGSLRELVWLIWKAWRCPGRGSGTGAAIALQATCSRIEIKDSKQNKTTQLPERSLGLDFLWYRYSLESQTAGRSKSGSPDRISTHNMCSCPASYHSLVVAVEQE